MPYRQSLRASNPKHILTVWRQERANRVSQRLAWSGLGLAAIGTAADLLWSPMLVIATDLVLLLGCAWTLIWLRSPSRPIHFWWPMYFGFWISILPSLWNTGGLASPFLGVDLAALYAIGAVMDTKNRSLAYFLFSLVHIPVFYALEFVNPLAGVEVPPMELIGVITGITLVAVLMCIHALLRTERELSLEFSEHYQNLSRTENELKEREGQLKEAQSIGRIGSWEWDLAKDHIRWSDELFSIFEVSKENFDPSFRGYLSRLNPEMREKIEGIVTRSMKTGEDFSFENKVVTSQGERFVQSHGRVVKGTSGQTFKMMGTCQDITDRKKTESQLIQARSELEQRVEERTLQLAQSLEREKAAKAAAENANQAKMQFLANMSHEIRTPMNSILGFSELIASGVDSPDEIKDYISRIRANGKQLLHLIDDILDLSKFEAGQIPIHKSYVALRSMVEDVVLSLRPLLLSKKLELEVSYADNTNCDVLTDGQRLRQILTNLLSNAIKFSENGKINVDISCSPSEQKNHIQLAMDVRDTGIGITVENQSKLFQPFSQGDSSVARRFGGSGLGLALSKRIAQALGGDLILVKSNPGEGSHFRFSIPVQFLPSGSSRQEAAPETEITLQPVSLAHKRILLVEDAKDNEILIAHYLKPLGLKVDVAVNGLQAIEMVQKNDYDCILMDIQMPGMDGLEATRRIRAMGYSKPIIALTAHALPAERERSLAAGCDLHLTKPIQRSDLIGTLCEQLKASEL